MGELCGEGSGEVLARVETIRAGDRVLTPRGPLDGYEVADVRSHSDGTLTVVYRTRESAAFRFGEKVLRTPNVLASLRALPAGERVRCLRAAPHDRAGRARPTV